MPLYGIKTKVTPLNDAFMPGAGPVDYNDDDEANELKEFLKNY